MYILKILGYETIYNRSLNGIKTISDGIATISNGAITANSLNASTVSTSTFDVAGDIEIAGNIIADGNINMTNASKSCTLKSPTINGPMVFTTTINGINTSVFAYLSNVSSDIQAQINAILASSVSLSGANAWSGTNTFNTNLPTSILTPSSNTQLITKIYGDSNYASLSSDNTFTGVNTGGIIIPSSKTLRLIGPITVGPSGGTSIESTEIACLNNCTYNIYNELQRVQGIQYNSSSSLTTIANNLTVGNTFNGNAGSFSGALSCAGFTASTISATTGTFSNAGSTALTVTGTSSVGSINLNGTSSLSNASLQFVDYLGIAQALLYPSVVSSNFKFDTSMANGVGFAHNGATTFNVDNNGNGTFVGSINGVNAVLSGDLTCNNISSNALITYNNTLSSSSMTNNNTGLVGTFVVNPHYTKRITINCPISTSLSVNGSNGTFFSLNLTGITCNVTRNGIAYSTPAVTITNGVIPDNDIFLAGGSSATAIYYSCNTSIYFDCINSATTDTYVVQYTFTKSSSNCIIKDQYVNTAVSGQTLSSCTRNSGSTPAGYSASSFTETIKTVGGVVGCVEVNNLVCDDTINTVNMNSTSGTITTLTSTTSNTTTSNATTANITNLVAGQITPRYVSSWTSVLPSKQTYTFTHNLNMSLAFPLRYMLFYSDNASPTLGTNLIFDITGQNYTYGDETGYVLEHFDANTIKITTALTCVAKGFHAGTSYNQTSGYYRLYIY